MLIFQWFLIPGILRVMSLGYLCDIDHVTCYIYVKTSTADIGMLTRLTLQKFGP